MAKKPRYYVVWKGRTVGIFTSWSQARASINGFSRARFTSFANLSDAELAFHGHFRQDSQGEFEFDGWHGAVASQAPG